MNTIKKFKLMKYSLLLLMLSIFMSSCATRPDDNTVKLTVNIKTNQLTNSGKNFYVFLREDSDKKFTSATYEDIYNSFFDDNDRAKKVFVVPGNTCITTNLRVNRGESVSVYVLFSDFGYKAWKYRVNEINVNEEFTFTLGKNTITNVDIG